MVGICQKFMQIIDDDNLRKQQNFVAIADANTDTYGLWNGKLNFIFHQMAFIQLKADGNLSDHGP